jgi:hygromycin-B 4-O-kinase
MAPTMSVAQARAFLEAHGHAPRDMVPLSGGMWSATFAFSEREREYVIRFHQRRDDLEKDQFAMRWSSPRLRTPRMVEVGDAPGGGYGISEREEGSPIDDLDVAGMRQTLPALFATLDAVREASVAGTSGYGGWHGDGNATHATWRETLLDGEARSHSRATLVGSRLGTDAFDTGVARIRELVDACPEERHVVHNDLLYRNVLAGPRGIVMLDWGASIYGDFLYDMALLTIWWPFYASRWRGIDIRAEIERHYREIGLQVPQFAERLRCYELDIAVNHIAFQWEYGMPDEAAWTARRTTDLAKRDLASSD